MKKLIAMIGAVMLAVLPVFAEMDSITYSFPGSSSTTGTAVQSKSYIINGTLESVFIDVTGLTTGTVAVTRSDKGGGVTNTLFSKALITADAAYNPTIASHDAQGAVLYWQNCTNGVVLQTMTNLTKAALCGPVKVTFTGQAADTSTNDVDVTLFFSK